MEASNRLKQAQDFSTNRKVQHGNSRVHQDLPDSRGMDFVDRPSRRLPSHPHPPNSRKYLTQSLGRIINQKKNQLKPTQVFFVRGLRIHLDLALVKPSQERWLKLQDLILRLKSKHVSTARCLMSLTELLASTKKMVPEGLLHIYWTETSVDRNIFCTPRLVAEPHKRNERCRPSSQDHSIQLFTDASNEGWGAHLDQSSTKGLWSEGEKRLHINVLELKAVSLALRSFKDQCQNQTVLVTMVNSGSLHKQTRRNSLSGDVRTSVEYHDV